MPTTAKERALHASRQAQFNAMVRRWQRAVREMRDHGLVVHVQEEVADGTRRDHPYFTAKEIFRAVSGR